MSKTKRYFKSFLDGWNEYTGEIESPEGFKLWTAISILAGAIERKLWINTGDGAHYCNMYIFMIGERSTGKSYMTNIGIRMLEQVPGITMAANKMTDAVLIKRLSATGLEKRFEFQGETYQDSSIFIYGSEAATTFKEMHNGGSIIDTLTDLYNCNDGVWTHKASWTKDTQLHGKQSIINPCINLLACSTPAWLVSKVLSKDDMEGGFASRIVMVTHKGSFGREKGLQVNSIARDKLKYRVIDELKHVATLKGPYALDPSFTEADAFYKKQHNQRMIRLQRHDQVLANCLARKSETFLQKLSMIIAASERDELVLRASDAHQAWEMLSALEANLPYALRTYGIADEVRHTREILLYLMEENRLIARTEILLAFATKYTNRKINEGLMDLERQGRITKIAGVDDVYFKLAEQVPDSLIPSHTEFVNQQ